MIYRSALAILFLSIGLQAAEPYSFPPASVDAEIFGNQSPQTYFQRRQRNNSRCVAQLVRNKQLHQQAVDRLTRAVKGKLPAATIESLEEKADEARYAYHDSLAQCGHCAVRPIEKKSVVGATGNQVWYAVNGSCWNPGGNTAAEIRQAYQKRVESLLWTRNYAKNTGGYPQIFSFVEVDPRTGAILPSRKLTSPFLGYMAIRGPAMVGVQIAFGYTFESRLGQTSDGFVYEFEAEPAPRGFHPPRVYDLRASGERKRVRVIPLNDVLGKWYVSRDGYIRFFMAADLKMDLDYAKVVARRTLLDSLVHFAAKGESR